MFERSFPLEGSKEEVVLVSSWLDNCFNFSFIIHTAQNAREKYIFQVFKRNKYQM